MTYPIVEDYCNDRDLGVMTEVRMDDEIQAGLSISFPPFKFVQGGDEDTIKMGFECSVCTKRTLKTMHKTQFSKLNFTLRLLFVTLTMGSHNVLKVVFHHLSIKMHLKSPMTRKPTRMKC